MTKLLAFSHNTLGFSGVFRSVARNMQSVALAVAAFFATLCDVLQTRSVAQSGAEKSQPTQWDGLARNSATLLLLIINNITYVYVYMHAYRGSYRTGLKVVRPPCGRVVGCAL